MALETAVGIIIRLSDYSETSQIATFLTDRLGKVSTIAKGAKRAGSSTGGTLDMLTLNEIVFSSRSSGTLAILREAKTIEQFPVGQLSPSHYYAALYFAELSDIFSEGSVGEGGHFELLLSSLRALVAAGSEAIGNLIAYFESHVLMVSGLAPNLAECAACGAAAGRAPARISLSQGGVLCPKCSGGVAIPPATLAALRRVCQSTLKGVGRLRLNKRLAGEVGGVLSGMILHGADRVPRLLKYVRPDFEKSWRRWGAADAARKPLEG